MYLGKELYVSEAILMRVSPYVVMIKYGYVGGIGQLMEKMW
jgi:hypothetical protein